MSSISSEYIAGLVDGEGWIGFSKHPEKTCRLGFNLTPAVQISMRNNDDVLKFIADKYHGFFLSRYVRPNRRPNEKPISTVIIQWRAVPSLLKDILPYLHCKKEQAQTMLNYFEECFPKVRGQNGRFMGDPSILKKIDYYNKFKLLNAGGKGIIPSLIELPPVKPPVPSNWKPLFTEGELQELYVIKGYSGAEIAKVKNCSRTTVDKYRKIFNISARSKLILSKSRGRDIKGRFA